MTFQKLSLLFAFVALISSFSHGRTIMYLEYNNDCMTKMSYREVSQVSPPNLVHYYTHTYKDAKLILETSEESTGYLVKDKPSKTKQCTDINFNKLFAQAVNSGDIILYIVSPEAHGYRINFVSSVSLLSYDGKLLYYNGYNFDFAVDMTQPIGSDNLSLNADATEIYFQGNTGMDCEETYHFRRNTRNTCDPYKIIRLTPEVGVISIEEKEYHGGTLNGKLKSYELESINGFPANDYIQAICKGNPLEDPSLIAYRNDINNDFTEAPGATPKSGPSNKINLPNQYSYPVYDGTGKPDKKTTPSVTDVSPETLADNSKPKDISDKLPAGFTVKGEDNLENFEFPLPDVNAKPRCIKSAKKGYHVVQPDETLSFISRKTGVSVANLVNWNGLTDGDRIYACSELKLSPPQNKNIPKSYDSVPKKKDVPEPHNTFSNNKSADKKTPVKTKSINQKPQKIDGIHIVREGETLYLIAKTYGYTVDKFMEFNGLETDIISPMMVLKTSNCACKTDGDTFTSKGDDAKTAVPTELPTSFGNVPVPDTPFQINTLANIHIVEIGESLYTISKKYGISMDVLMEINDIKTVSSIRVGQKIRLR
jgi:LysM repeat protein